MTPELAKRILARTTRSILTDRMRTAILMDWLEGMPYKQLTSKYNVSKNAITVVVRNAKQEASAVLEGEK